MSRKGFLLFAAMCVIWGIPYLLIRIAVGSISPGLLVFGRTAIGAIILMPLVLVRQGLRGIGRRWIPLLVYSVVEVAGPWFFLSHAEQHISSALAGLLISAVPLVSVIIAPFFVKQEKMGAAGIGGLVLGLLGVAAIVGLDLGSTDVVSLLEMGLVAIGYAVGPMIIRRYLSDLPPVTVVGVSLAVCALGYAPAALVSWPSILPGADVLASVGILGVICTALAFLVFVALIAEIGPVRATVITYVNPAVAAVLGVLVLQEAFTLGMGLGFALVLAGSILATRRSPQAGREAARIKAGEKG